LFDATVLVAVITNFILVITTLITRNSPVYSKKKSKTDTIMRQQYEKVFSPMHSILFHQMLSKEEKLEHFDKIVAAHYLLVPPEISLIYREALSGADTKPLEKLVESAYSIARSKLGYTQIKVRRIDKETKKLVGSNKETNLTVLIAVFAMICVTVSILLICIAEKGNGDKGSDFIVETTMRKQSDRDWSDNIEVKDGDIVECQVRYKNIGLYPTQNVIVKAVLPQTMRYVNDSTRVYNTTNPDGIIRDNTISSGVNIGGYSPSGDGYVRFYVEILYTDLEDESQTVYAWGQVGVGQKTKQDSATVTILR